MIPWPKSRCVTLNWSEIMKITFIGAGEAFDPESINISMMLESNAKILLDCGYNVPQKLWQMFPDSEYLDGVFVSHFHSDHVAGLPMLIMKMRQDKRKKALTIIGPKGFEDDFRKLYELNYKGFLGITGFPMNFIEAKGGDTMELEGVKLSFADASHLENTPYFVPTLALRADSGGKSMCYSSDTVYTTRIVELAKNCDMLVHDSYMPADSDYHKSMPAHGSPKVAGRVAKEANARRLALFNIHRSFNNNKSVMLNEATNEFGGEILMPSEGESFIL